MLDAGGIRRKPMKENAPVPERPAPLWRRLLALLYELLAVAAILFVITMAGLLLTHNRLDHTALVFRIALLVGVEAYFVASWVRGGQSLGMRAWRLHLRTDAGGTPDLARAILRFTIVASPLLLLALALVAGTLAGLVAPLVAWAVDLAVAGFDRRGRALHDILAGTWIAYRPPAA